MKRLLFGASGSPWVVILPNLPPHVGFVVEWIQEIDPELVKIVHVAGTTVNRCTHACAGKARSRGTRCRDVIFETLFETLWVSNPIRPRSAASRNRVMRGPGVTQGAKRSQGARRPRD